MTLPRGRRGLAGRNNPSFLPNISAFEHDGGVVAPPPNCAISDHLAAPPLKPGTDYLSSPPVFAVNIFYTCEHGQCVPGLHTTINYYI